MLKTHKTDSKANRSPVRDIRLREKVRSTLRPSHFGIWRPERNLPRFFAPARSLAAPSLPKRDHVSRIAGRGSENMTNAAVRQPNAGTTPDGDGLVWCFCGTIRCALIHSAITKGERQRRSASTTSSPTRETWTCSGTKATGSRSACAAIRRRQRSRKDDGAELLRGRREQHGCEFGSGVGYLESLRLSARNQRTRYAQTPAGFKMQISPRR